MSNDTRENVHYDYARQCWVVDGTVARCGHVAPFATCYACAHHGETVEDD